ncbi:MAG TPA: alpha/beta fold hydrolase [Candidatus Limnocylindria bacterium]|jgi:carboxylesterase|nr:alpha/beta fold hydrolase [Candidatus Limnocylindria bacterium]
MLHVGAWDVSLIRGDRDKAVLLLHGLTGTPLDVYSVRDALVAEGYTVSTPLLPGRGTCPADMDALCWEDWMSFALEAYDELAREHREVIVGGLSAGGTMALDMALRRRPSALLLYATALAIGHRMAYLAPYVWRLIRRWPSPATDLLDQSVGAKCYDPAPVRAVGELIAGIARVRGRLSEIGCPALVAHSVCDRLVPVAYARDLAQRLGGPVRTLFLEGSGHAITVDARRTEIAQATVAFLRQTMDFTELRSA